MNELINKIDAETAANEFERFTAAWDIDTDLEDMESDDVQSFESQKRRIVKAIKQGRLSVDDTGETISYNLHDKVHSTDVIKMSIPKGEAFMSMDKYKDKQQIHKLHAFMAASSKLPVQIFSGMDGRDLKLLMGVALLFLAS